MVLNGIGTLFCSYLLYLTFSGKAGHFCELFGTDCLSAIHSKYGRFLNFSSASLGLGYFTFQLLLLLGLKKVSPFIRSCSFTGTGVNTAGQPRINSQK